MRMKLLTLAISLLTAISLQAQTNEHYIEVTGTSEIEIVPDKIHYLIEIREYFEEEFDGKSKPEQYRTKVPLHKIEQGVKKSSFRVECAAKRYQDARNRRLLEAARTRLSGIEKTRYHTDRVQPDQ